MAGPKRLSQIEAKQLCSKNERVVWQKMVAGKKVGWRKSKPTVKQGPTLNRESHKGKGNHKIVKNGQQTTQANHGRHMSSRQILDIHGREARARLRPHRLVPSQYRTRWGHGSEVRGHGLAVERGKNLFWGSCSGSFGGSVLLGWHTTQRGKFELEPLSAYHEG